MPGPRTYVERRDTHRLIPTRYVASVLEKLELPAHVVDDLTSIDALTNQRILAEQGREPGVSLYELTFGVREAKIIDAAFSHRSDYGSRFNDSQRGAWYAAFDLGTAAYEVAYHRTRLLRNTRSTVAAVYDYQDFETDFRGEFDSLTDDERVLCLQPEPVPRCYRAGQQLAGLLLEAGSPGLLYPNTRDPHHGMCLVCFRPALVANTRRTHAYHLTVDPSRALDLERDFSIIAA